jgi:multimeric flavodoxin WrbA
MKILGINASPRVGRFTSRALSVCLSAAAEANPQLEIETIELGGIDVGFCTGCQYCRDEFGCTVQDDFQSLIETLNDRDLAGIVFATPVYFGSMTAQGKAFWDRSLVLRHHDFALAGKVGAVITTGGARNGGQELAISHVHAAMLVHDMTVVSDSSHFGGTVWSSQEGGVDGDRFGLRTLDRLGKRVAATV